MRIKCPECSQKFEVSEDFLGKTVECGACDKRFKVTDAEIYTEKKRFYPGEKKNRHLDNFGKSAATLDAPVAFQQAHYQKVGNADVVNPTGPGRILAVFAGALLMIVVIVVFLLVGGPEGSLREMETLNRFILVGFTALVGGGLLCYGTFYNRKVGWLVALVLCVALLVLPVVFPGNPAETTLSDDFQNIESEEVKSIDQETSMDDYLFEIGYDPVRKKIKAGEPNTVVAVHLRDTSSQLRRKIAAYLYESTDKVSREISYERGTSGRRGLILLVEQKKTLDEIALLCEKFGRITKISRDHRLIDVTVEQTKVVGLDEDKALDPESLDFQRQNLKALLNIDPDIQMKAVMRLATSEPKALRPDITEQMVTMLPKANNELKIELIRALKVWSQPGDGSEKAVMTAAKILYQAEVIEKDAVEFLIAREVDEVSVMLLELWRKDPVSWADTMKGLGEGAQILLLPILTELEEAQLIVASDILGETGNETTISHIEAAMEKSTSDVVKKSMQAAIDEIKNAP